MNEYLTTITNSITNESSYEVSNFSIDVSGRIKGDNLVYKLVGLESLNSINVVELYSDSLTLNVEPNQSKKFCFLIHIPRSFVGLDLEYSFHISKVFVLSNGYETKVGL